MLRVTQSKMEMELEFIKSLLFIFGASAIVIFILNRLKVPSIVGFLLAGTIMGPYGMGLSRDTHLIEVLAEIGVVFLLFTIGIEFSLERLIKMKKAVLKGGGVQLTSTILIVSLLSYIITSDLNRSIFTGFLVALSSTAIVLKLLADQGQSDSPHGRMMTGILIFQDLCVVPMMLLLPTLAAQRIQLTEMGLMLLRSIFIIAVVLISARWVVPLLLNQIVKTRVRELFIISVIFVIFGIAFLTSEFGLSLALGAFLAGLVISESEYSYQVLSDIIPLKEIFMAMFLVSIGMLLDVNSLAQHLWLVSVSVIAVSIIKVSTGFLSVLVNGYAPRIALHTGLGLFQVGEFSFVLAVAGKGLGLITEEFYQVFISSSVITMFLTPIVFKYAPSVSAWLTSRKALRRLGGAHHFYRTETRAISKRDHVIIIGFGLNGRNLARVLRMSGIPYVVLELNIDTVTEMKKKGEPIYYGDGTSVEVLHRLGIKRARMLVIAISDPVATRRIVSIARQENPELYIIVRTRYTIEVDELRRLGADEVIPEEFETSIEIFSRVLAHYNIPRNQIEDFIAAVRADNYSILRAPQPIKRPLSAELEVLSKIEIDRYMIKEGSAITGHTLRELNLRNRTGATVIAIKRGKEVLTNPSPSTVLEEGDILWLIGSKQQLNRAVEYLNTERFLIEKYQ